MKKEIKEKFGKNYFLLGIRKDKKKVWLEQAKFECGWYWGIGYVEVFNNHYTDIEEHTHFDSLFLSKDIYNSFIEYFEEMTISKNEVWKLLELMKTLYELRSYADFLTRGGSHITSNMFSDKIKNDNELKRINNELIPTIQEEVYKMLGGKN